MDPSQMRACSTPSGITGTMCSFAFGGTIVNTGQIVRAGISRAASYAAQNAQK
jgi:hypothetical protein